MSPSAKKNLQVHSPYNGRLLKTVPLQSVAAVDRMLKRAAGLHKKKEGWLQHSERIAILHRLAELVEKGQNKFAQLIAAEGGKPLTDARVEVARAIDGIRLAAKEISHVVRGTEIPMGLTAASHNRLAWTTKEPIGVVVAVSAFNHPLNLIVHQAVPAIAVGCPVIVKPASATPLNCLALQKLAEQAGLPPGWFQVSVCSNEAAQKLVTDSRVRFFSFIGSAQIGWMLRSKLAPGVRCALEHGGVAPVIVDSSADVKKMIPLLIKGGFYHAGQVCVSVQRVYAPKKMARSLAESLAKEAKKLSVGDPSKAKTQVGPLIQTREVDRVDEWVKKAVKEGAKLVCGGRKLSKTTYAPTVLFNPSRKSEVSTSEIFGPVICVYPYTSRKAAIAESNSLDVAFQASVFSNDLEATMDTVKRLDATAVMVNDHTAFRVDWMPFGGRRHSGLGMGGIGYTMHDMVQDKMLVINTS